MPSRRTMLKTAGVLAVALGTGGTRAAEAAPRAAPDTGKLQAALDATAATAASGVLAEVRGAGWVWRGAAGAAELGAARPVPVNGRFRAGSITKSFVSTVVLQLVGDGRLGFDDPVERWLPGTVPAGDRITLHDLLQHTSGIVNYTNTDEFRALYGTIDDILSLRYRTWAPAELLAWAVGKPLLFEPGTSWTYSNTNYILLALVIEKATGRPYAAEVERRIFRPLGLCDTAMPGADPDIAGPHPHGYLPDEQGGTVEPVDITVFNPTVAGAAGQLITTTADLNHFYRALLTGGLLRPAQLAQMRTALPTGRDFDYGLGLMTRLAADGTRLWGHTGDIFGYQTECWTSEDGSRQLAVSACPWGADDLDDLLDDVRAAAFAVQ